jgi:hypothetical protein
MGQSAFETAKLQSPFVVVSVSPLLYPGVVMHHLNEKNNLSLKVAATCGVAVQGKGWTSP